MEEQRFVTKSMSIVLAVNIIMTVIFSSMYLSNAMYPFRPKLQPSNGAFGIWSIIFLSASSHSIYAFFYGSQALSENALRLQSMALLFQSLAFLFCSVWSYVFYKQYLRVSGAVLTMAFLLSLSAVVSDAFVFSEERGMWKPFLFRRVSVGLFSGWLLVASALSLTFVFRDALDKEWIIVPLASLSMIISISTRQPFFAISLLWALLFSTNNLSTYPFTTSMLINAFGLCFSVYLCV